MPLEGGAVEVRREVSKRTFKGLQRTGAATSLELEVEEFSFVGNGVVVADMPQGLMH